MIPFIINAQAGQTRGDRQNGLVTASGDGEESNGKWPLRGRGEDMCQNWTVMTIAQLCKYVKKPLNCVLSQGECCGV